jgi:hypothetical protein
MDWSQHHESAENLLLLHRSVLALALCAGSPAWAQSKPNILFIMG